MRSFYMMLATVALMVVFGLSLVAITIVKYVTYKPRESRGPVSSLVEHHGTPQVTVQGVGETSVAETPQAAGTGNFDDTHTSATPVQNLSENPESALSAVSQPGNAATAPDATLSLSY